MKSTECLPVLQLSLFLLAGPVVARDGPAGPVPARFAGELRNDERMWGLMRQMLVDFGYQEKVALMDAAWEKTNSPQQWAVFKQEQAALTNSAVAAARLPEWRAAISPGVQAIATLCKETAAGGFARVIIAVCKTSHNVVDITAGLILWTNEGGVPLLQGQNDKALHFIYGAYLEAILGMGHRAGVMKEQSDVRHGRTFDCNDMAATFAGAESVRRAKTDGQWIDQWASGRKTFAANLPALHYDIYKQSEPSEAYTAQIQLAVRNSFNR